MTRNALATALAFVLSPNYLDRANPVKWLARPNSDKDRIALRDDLIPTKAMIGEGVEFTNSSAFESGFGCSLVAMAQNYNAYPEVEVPADAVKLHFTGSYFIEERERGRGTYGNSISKADTVYFAADGGVYAKGLTYQRDL